MKNIALIYDLVAGANWRLAPANIRGTVSFHCRLALVPNHRKKVLHIAYDPAMVGVQRRLMETSGYEVFTVFARQDHLKFDLAGLGINVVLLDHSASFEERWAIVRRLKLAYPDVPVVALRRDALDEPVTLADHQVSVENPADWLDTIAVALT